MSTELTLNRKLEEAFKGWLEQFIVLGAPLVGFNIYSGRGSFDNRELPMVNVFCSKISENTEYPPNSGEYVATMVFHSVAQFDDSSLANIDAQMYYLEGILKSVSQIKAFINKDLYATEDLRTIKNIYIYDIKEDDETHDFGGLKDRSIDDIFTYKVPCRNDNGDGT